VATPQLWHTSWCLVLSSSMHAVKSRLAREGGPRSDTSDTRMGSACRGSMLPATRGCGGMHTLTAATHIVVTCTHGERPTHACAATSGTCQCRQHPPTTHTTPHTSTHYHNSTHHHNSTHPRLMHSYNPCGTRRRRSCSRAINTPTPPTPTPTPYAIILTRGMNCT
jgi:hypothetical protein